LLAALGTMAHIERDGSLCQLMTDGAALTSAGQPHGVALKASEYGIALPTKATFITSGYPCDDIAAMQECMSRKTDERILDG
jgi:hypothetical protein